MRRWAEVAKILTVLSAGVATSQRALPAHAAGELGGLEMRLVRDYQPRDTPRFRLELHNAGSQGMLIEIGEAWSQGRRQDLTSFRYLLRMPTGRVVALSWPELASSFGQPAPEPLIAPLPVSARLSLPVDFAQLRLRQMDDADWRVHLAPGHNVFWVEYRHEMPGTGVSGPAVLPLPSRPFWVGSIRTEPVAFTLP